MIFTRRNIEPVQFEAESRPALTREARENQLIALSMDRAEAQLRDGTASSQVITHFLKMGSLEKQIELEKLRRENELLKAKTESIRLAARSDELTEKALAAFRQYSGNAANEELVDDDLQDL